MDKKIKSELDELVSVITRTVPASAVFLFGSFAYGIPDADSDIDLYIVIPDGSLRPIEAMRKISAAILPVQKRPVDILVGSENIFRERSASAAIEREVAQKGIRIFSRPDALNGEAAYA